MTQFSAKFELGDHHHGVAGTEREDPPQERMSDSVLRTYKWIEAWKFYFRVILPYLQAIFLPLQMEIKGSRLVNSIQTLVLLAYRDNVVFPALTSLESTVSPFIWDLSTVFIFRIWVLKDRISFRDSSNSDPYCIGTTTHILQKLQSPHSSDLPPPELLENVALLTQMLLILSNLPTTQKVNQGAEECEKIRMLKEILQPLKSFISSARCSK